MADDELSRRRKRKQDLEAEINEVDDKLVTLRNMILGRMEETRDEGAKGAFGAVINFMSFLGLWSRGNDD